jgi:hypothetical protein
MFDLHFEINGKKVEPESIGKELEKAVYKSMADEIQKRLKEVLKDDEIGKLTLKFTGSEGDKINCELDGPEHLLKKAETVID